MTRRARTAWALATTLALAACQTAPQVAAAPEDAGCAPGPAAVTATFVPAGTAAASAAAPLSLQGQISVKLEAFGDQAAKGLSLGFFFQGHSQAGEMDLMTLMGSQVAHLHWSPSSAELTDQQGAHRYPDLAALSDAALGEALPLDTLVHWMQGRPDPAQPSQTQTGAHTFSQLGWLVDTREFDQRKLTVTRNATPAARGVRIKVYLDR